MLQLQTMKAATLAAIMLVLCCMMNTAGAQLYKITLDEKLRGAAFVAEAKVISKKSFWNDAHTMIYTANTIQLYKVFKGNIPAATVEVLTLGGTAENYCIEASDLLQLETGYTGIFFCSALKKSIVSPAGKKVLFDVYGSAQGFLRYDAEQDAAFAPFVSYKGIEKNLYPLLQRSTGIPVRIIDRSFSIHGEGETERPGGVAAIINSFSPASVHGGALNDPTNNLLTINGSGFEANPSGKCAVRFKDGNSFNTSPDYDVPYNSPYIVSWTDTKIVVRVPARAATGKFGVRSSGGNFTAAPGNLDVFFGVLNADFLIGGDTLTREPRLMNVNGSGGYSIVYSTSTAGGGVNFATSDIRPTFERAVTTWKETAGANLQLSGNTTSQEVDVYDDKNVVMFDNNNTSIPNLTSGVLATTFSGFSMCNDKSYSAQKTGFDIVVRNSGVSSGSVDFTAGPCFPDDNQIDMEMVLLHELGHALNLAHINDDYESTSTSNCTINPEKLMHYSVLEYADRRSLDASAQQAALYTIEPQGNNYGTCGLAPAEMTQGFYTIIPNDECPGTFPATAITDGTTISVDLVHATSNKFGDPAFDQVNCQNTGTFVTNNAYYAFLSDTASNRSVALTISNYTTIPAEAKTACGLQGVRLALYDVSSCPEGQNFPQPIDCNTFIADGTLLPLNGLQPNHKYLLYFDGLRNTKASFTVTFNGSAPNPGNEHPLPLIYPNPVRTTLHIKFTETSTTKYQYSMYDARGRQVALSTISVTQANEIVNIPVGHLAPGVYFMRLADASGTVVIKQKIIRE